MLISKGNIEFVGTVGTMLLGIMAVSMPQVSISSTASRSLRNAPGTLSTRQDCPDTHVYVRARACGPSSS